MATATYTEVLELVEQLPLEAQRRLRDELATRGAAQAEAEAFLVRWNALGAEISAAWKDDMSAVDAVREQRREL